MLENSDNYGVMLYVGRVSLIVEAKGLSNKNWDRIENTRANKKTSKPAFSIPCWYIYNILTFYTFSLPSGYIQ